MASETLSKRPRGSGVNLQRLYKNATIDNDIASKDSINKDNDFDKLVLWITLTLQMWNTKCPFTEKIYSFLLLWYFSSLSNNDLFSNETVTMYNDNHFLKITLQNCQYMYMVLVIWIWFWYRYAGLEDDWKRNTLEIVILRPI